MARWGSRFISALAAGALLLGAAPSGAFASSAPDPSPPPASVAPAAGERSAPAPAPTDAPGSAATRTPTPSPTTTKPAPTATKAATKAAPKPAPSRTAAAETPPATTPAETPAASPSAAPAPAPTSQAATAAGPSIRYRAHVQAEGWHDLDTDGTVAGSNDLSRRVEAVRIALSNAPEGSGVTYRTAVRTKGWITRKADGDISGTVGQGLPVEAIEIGLSGPIARTHDLWYRVRVTELGWMAWARDGSRAGTTMSNMQISAVQIVLVPRGAPAPEATGATHPRAYVEPVVHYVSHVQGIGWQRAVVNGATSGDPGRRARVEAVRASLTGAPFTGGIQVAAHVQRIGWQGWKGTDATAGTTGRALRIEALKFKLTGGMAAKFNVYYRAYVQGFGWLGWTSNGHSAGSEGMGLRLVAYQVRIVPKGTPGPGGGAAFIPKPRYQTPGGYAKISYAGQPTPKGVGFDIRSGREGAKVKAIANKFGIARATQWVDDTFMAKVRGWQRSHGLPQTGVVDKRTWVSMGFSASSWTALDGYVSPLRAKPTMTRSQLISAMIAAARSYEGSPYVWGGSNSPSVGADCVGVVMQALLAVGINVEPSNSVTHTLPGNTTPREIYASKKFKHVPYSQRQPGDLIFQAHDPRDPHTVRHVQMYLGNGMVMESVHVGGIVRPEHVTYPASMDMPTVVRPIP